MAQITTQAMATQIKRPIREEEEMDAARKLMSLIRPSCLRRTPERSGVTGAAPVSVHQGRWTTLIEMESQPGIEPGHKVANLHGYPALNVRVTTTGTKRPGVIEFLRLNPRSKGISRTAARFKVGGRPLNRPGGMRRESRSPVYWKVFCDP